MKVNELMIRDWVYRTDFNTPAPSKIIGMEVVNYDKMEYVVDVFNKNRYNVQLYLNEIEPIPLTPEILEKNGFERCVNSISRISVSSIPICESNQFANKEFGGNTRIIDMGTHGFTLLTDVFGMTDKNKVNHLFYLHELQHALSVCGIDKTITL